MWVGFTAPSCFEKNRNQSLVQLPMLDQILEIKWGVWYLHVIEFYCAWQRSENGHVLPWQSQIQDFFNHDSYMCSLQLDQIYLVIRMKSFKICGIPKTPMASDCHYYRMILFKHSTRMIAHKQKGLDIIAALVTMWREQRGSSGGASPTILSDPALSQFSFSRLTDPEGGLSGLVIGQQPIAAVCPALHDAKPQAIHSPTTRAF